jgi:hypothetical protein
MRNGLGTLLPPEVHAEHAERAEERHAENDLSSEIADQRRAPLGEAS